MPLNPPGKVLFSKNTLEPKYILAKQYTSNLSLDLATKATRAIRVASSTFDGAKSKISSADPKQIALNSCTLVRDHPYQTAFYCSTGVLVAAPAILAVPALGAAGFGSGGVVAGSAAAASQSAGGSIAAGSLFATLQSAGAGGYGVPIVYGAVQGGAATVGAVTAGVKGWMGWKKSAKEEAQEDEVEQEESEEVTGSGGAAPGAKAKL